MRNDLYNMSDKLNGLDELRSLERMKRYSDYIKGYVHKLCSDHPALIVNADMLAYEIDKLMPTERAEKVREELGCGYCNGEGTVSFVYHPTDMDYGIQAGARYCPMCGRDMNIGQEDNA